MGDNKTEIYNTGCGKIRGEDLGEALLFRGVPYADTARFEKPILTKKWEGVLEATGHETDCWQLSAFCDEGDSFYYKEFRGKNPPTGVFGDGPMTLNVITPAMTGKRPVLMFIHGGSFETGTVGEAPYGTTVEYAKRDVVLVSVGYRLNVFGLYGGTNNLLYDQICALDWIRENISAFGGDPDNITIMGQSAGAMSVMDLLCSDKLKGKVTHAIMMSGAGVVPKVAAPLKKSEVMPFWQEVREAAGGDPATVDAKKLWMAWRDVKKKQKPIYGLRITQPCIDGDILRDTQGAIVKGGGLLDVPIMAGITSQDMMPMFIHSMALKLGLVCDKQGHKPVYGYLFDRELPGNSYKAFHASDLWYMFGNHERSWRPFDETDRKLSAVMMDNVAAFCRSGKPADKSWLAISKSQRGFRHFDGISEGMCSDGYCKKKMVHTMLRDPGPA